MAKFLTKILLFTFCVTSLFASAADKKTDEEKTAQTKKTRYIIEPIVTQPKCTAKDRPYNPEPRFRSPSERIVNKYAAILPAFAKIQKQPNCNYLFTGPHSSTTTAGLPYISFSIWCNKCQFSPNFFHIPLRTPEYERCPQVMCRTIQKQGTDELQKQVENLGFDKTKGMFRECLRCTSAEFVTTEDPAQLKSKTSEQSTGDEFWA